MIVIIFMLYGSALLSSEVLAGLPDTIYDKFSQSDFKLKFEHLDLDHYDNTIVKEMKVVTFKYNRTYTACNGSAELKIDLNNELEAIVQAYKFASNEYRLFRVRFQLNSCRAISKNLIGLADFTKCGNFSGCPLKKGVKIHVCNWSTDESKYPPFFPTGRYMLDIQLMYGDIEVALLKAYVEVYRPIPIPD